MAEIDVEPRLQDCWNQIGVLGDRSCPLLPSVIHCRNCAVYSAAGRSLLARSAPPGYLEEWTQVLGEVSPSDRTEAIVPSSKAQSLMLFRLGAECLALPIRLFQLITPPASIHQIPHRSSPVLLGLGNIRGEIVVCVSLSALLGISAKDTDSEALTQITQPQTNQPRWVVMGDPVRPWVSPVDEIYGIYRFAVQHFQEPPIVISQTEAFTQGITYWNDRKVNVLDSDRILQALEQAITR